MSSYCKYHLWVKYSNMLTGLDCLPNNSNQFLFIVSLLLNTSSSFKIPLQSCIPVHNRPLGKYFFLGKNESYARWAEAKCSRWLGTKEVSSAGDWRLWEIPRKKKWPYESTGLWNKDLAFACVGQIMWNLMSNFSAEQAAGKRLSSDYGSHLPCETLYSRPYALCWVWVHS